MKKILLLLIALPLAAAGQINSTIRGTIDGRPTDKLVLAPSNTDIRKPDRIIPVVDGRFEFEIADSAVRKWTLMYYEDVFENFGGQYYDFLTDAPIVEMIITPMSKDATIKGGELNRLEQEYEKKKFDIELPRQAEIKEIESKLVAMRDADPDFMNKLQNLDAHPNLRAMMEQIEVLDNVNRRVLTEHFWNLIEGQSSLAIYPEFLSLLQQRSFPADPSKIRRALAAFTAANPGHPYNDEAAKFAEAALRERPFDFTAPDIDGVMHNLSKEIEGKVAVIDLWASWCAGCLVHSRELIPVYNEWRDRGFTVVGVAREFKNLDALHIALAREKFPWVNMVELDDRQDIWMHYGVREGGGCLVLVGKDGRIVMRDPTAEQIKEYLQTI